MDKYANRNNRHHTIPLSIDGLDKPHNLMNLKQYIHKELHSILDIPRRELSRGRRDIRKKYNHKLIKTPDEVRANGDLQRLFFWSLDKLPPRLQQKHIKVMMWQVAYDRKRYKQATWDDFDKPRTSSNTKQQVLLLHDLALKAQEELSLVYQNTIKKTLYSIPNEKKDKRWRTDRGD